ncbi:hypothetical protein TNCV_4557801 [Trichonephila clavipes]|nr:hypothetical protein TNCV_4557801 [Trichonephila clavipes]
MPCERQFIRPQGRPPAELFWGRKLLTPFQKLVVVTDGAEFTKRHFNKRRQARTTYVQEIKLPKKLFTYQEERCKPKGDQSSPEENDFRSPARTDRVDNPDRSTNTRVVKSRSRGTEDPAVKVLDKVDNPDSKIARRRKEG